MYKTPDKTPYTELTIDQAEAERARVIAYAERLVETREKDGGDSGDGSSAFDEAIARAEELKALIEGLRESSEGRRAKLAAIRTTERGTDPGRRHTATRDAPGPDRPWAERAAAALIESRAVGDGLDVPFLLSQTVEADPYNSSRLVDALGRRSVSGHTYSFLQEQDRSNAAAAVPDGEDKPVSTLEVKQIEGQLSVYATVTAGIRNRYLQDDPAGLTRYLNRSLVDMVLDALNQDALYGDGTDDALLGLFEQPGTSTQPFETDVMTTLAAARVQLEQAGVTDGLVYVLNPADVQEHLVAPRAAEAGPWLNVEPGDGRKVAVDQVPIIKDPHVNVGDALLLQRSAVGIVQRENVRVDSDPFTRFQQNETIFRAESRFGLEVFRPAAVVQIALGGS